ncbi:GspH/FimT family pseudopilin [Granulosicoccus sp. 3-233]|uniref:GspH/FimT family pseudopilin n=1 Tax=Granulosicoccus sp. 3-233 TaxID=3417969 RepID=UPI003D338962
MSSTSFQPSGVPRQHALSAAGFTLLELIITLAISAVLIGLAVPSMKSFMGSSEISATSNDFVHSLQTARSEAIKRAGPVGLCPSDNPLADEPGCDATSYANGWIVFFDADGNGQRSAGEELVVRSESRSATFSFIPDTAFEQRIYFGESGSSINPAGVPLSGNIEIRLLGSDEQRIVRVAANGRIATLDVDKTETP